MTHEKLENRRLDQQKNSTENSIDWNLYDTSVKSNECIKRYKEWVRLKCFIDEHPEECKNFLDDNLLPKDIC